MKRQLVTNVAFSLLSSGLSHNANTDSATWTEAFGNIWGDGANTDQNQVTHYGDHAIVAATDSHRVTVRGSAYVGGLTSTDRPASVTTRVCGGSCCARCAVRQPHRSRHADRGVNEPRARDAIPAFCIVVTATWLTTFCHMQDQMLQRRTEGADNPKPQPRKRPKL